MNTKCPLVFQKRTYGEELYHTDFFVPVRHESTLIEVLGALKNADDIYQRYRFKAVSPKKEHLELGMV
ncbi:hypothetical protein TNCT_591381 [Trichonephila clavata]|uniref:Uncharacterized protein n=1 Tax=Trichonephila clavata TaxID=2740835 RepID=A0A8X6L6G3_TRICU|nr:hypothetical protein TNCT_591381 [Trichonephila clavata]